MDNMTITSAQYIVSADLNEITSVKATIDGQEMHVPLDPANRHYDEIMRQVDEGLLVIQEAE